MRHGGAPKLAQQPTHHMGRARTRKNCEERIEGRSSDRILGWSESGSRGGLKGGSFKNRSSGFFCGLLLRFRICACDDDTIPRKWEANKWMGMAAPVAARLLQQICQPQPRTHTCSEPEVGNRSSVCARQRPVETQAAARPGVAGLGRACLAERRCFLFRRVRHGKKLCPASPNPYL